MENGKSEAELILEAKKKAWEHVHKIVTNYPMHGGRVSISEDIGVNGYPFMVRLGINTGPFVILLPDGTWRAV